MNNILIFLTEEGPNGKFIPSDAKEFWWGALAFVIVFGLLVWKLSPVIAKMLAGRAEKVQTELATAEQAQAAADAEIAALKAKLGDAAADGRKLLEDAKSQAEKLKADSATKAASDAAVLRARATSDIGGMRSQASSDLEAEVTSRALQVAEEVVRANLDDATQAQLIEQYIDQVGAS